MMVVALCGCTQDVEVIVPLPSAPDGAIAININGSISQEYTTRVDDGGFCDGDQIGLYGVNYTDKNATQGVLVDSGNQVDNARYTYDEESMTWTSSGSVYYKDAETNIDLYAYYPYSNPQSVGAYKFEVAQDQSGENAVDGYGQSDFLWACAENVAPTTNAIKLRFSHRLSCVNVVLTEGDGYDAGEWDALDKGVLVMSTTRTADIDLSTGVATATGEAALEGIVMKDGTEGFRAIVVPQSVDAGKALLDITVDGITRRFKTDVATNYEAGKQTKYTLKVNKKSHSGEFELELANAEIIDWIADLDSNGGEAKQYYVVHLDEPGTLMQKLAEAKKDPAKIKNLKVSGKINAIDFYFMRDKMTLLQAVNLKESRIMATTYSEWYKNGYVSWEGYKDSKEIVEFVDYAEYDSSYGNPSFTNRLDENIIPGKAFAEKGLLTHFEFPIGVTEIGGAAFAKTLLSGALVIPDTVTKIGVIAFARCNNMSSISLPLNLISIGDYAFTGCGSLSGTLNLPLTLESIGRNAFDGCGGFSGPLILPESLKLIDGCAFRSCSGFVGDLVIPESVTALYGGTFWGCSGLNGSLVLHDSLELLTDTSLYDKINGHHGDQFCGCSFQGELKLPANLNKIPAGCFSSCEFSTIADFPEGLLEIGDSAFSNNWRLMGTLEFPESLVSLGSSAFSYCSTLEGIVLPSELGVIKESTFKGCYYLNKIVCRAKEPPIVQSRAFDGVAKDNFAVEVPESSVNRYQNEIGWNEFKRIVAHHDFTISRRLMRTLNAEHSRVLVLRVPANQAWSIESKPEWVTVNPSSGVGKTEVTVTVAEMTEAEVSTFKINTGAYNSPYYETHNGRAGDVVFLLNDKNYSTTLSVEQYDCDNYDCEVIINQEATKGNGVNLVFMGDCFDARDIAKGSYLEGINEAIGYYFDIEPYKTYREYFNVYTIVGMSNDSGMGTVNTIRDAKFGSQYSLEGIYPNYDKTYEYAMKASTVDESNIGETLVVLVENTTDYGGICYMWGDGSAIACCPMSRDAYPYDFRGIVQHEAGGHGFAKLGDEYIQENSWLQTCPPHYKEYLMGKALGWYRNLEETGDMDEVAWSHLIFHPKYSNIVDIYEGGYFHTRGVYRSEPNSCMNNNIPYYSAISRQEMVERIMRYAGEEFSLDDFYANDVLDTYGNTATRSAVEESLVISSGVGKQMPPKYMGESPLK